MTHTRHGGVTCIALGGSQATCNYACMFSPRKVWFLAVLGLVSGCAPPHAVAPTAVMTAPAQPASTTAVPPTTAKAVAPPVERPEWRKYFSNEHVAGTIAMFDSSDQQLSCSDVTLCQQATIPASTFKIANSMIALETGVVQDSESKLPWDGKYYTVPAWNQDNTLRTAVQVSCVPCFQAIARNAGEARMKEWVEKLDYGNKDISGGVNRFWLWGGLRISPLGQIDFLDASTKLSFPSPREPPRLCAT